MSLQKTMTQAIHEAPSALTRTIFITPMLLPVCCICGLIRDETKSSLHRERWVTPRTYRQTHGVNPADFSFTHTYCPGCFTKVQNSVRQYFRKIGTSS